MLRTQLLALIEDRSPALTIEEIYAAGDLMERVHDLLRKLADHPDWIDTLAQESAPQESFHD